MGKPGYQPCSCIEDQLSWGETNVIKTN